MSAERAPRTPAPLRLVGGVGGVGTREGDLIAVRLGSLVEALGGQRIPVRETEAIREELASHLHDRVRDLEITGMTEDDAVRCAAAELGDVSQLARRYREARTLPRRRLIMNLSMFAIAGAALVVGGVTLSQQGSGSRVSVFAPAQPTAEERTTLARTVQADFKDATVGDVFSFVSQTIGMPVNVAWSSMPGVSPEDRVSFVEKNADLRTILFEVGEDLGSGTDWTLDYRIADGAVRVGTQEYFDRRELVLASYDLSAFANDVSGEEVAELIKTFVNSSGWDDNGGTLARMSLVGTRMFVEAPRRYHVQIQWFIDELGKQPGEGHATGDTTLREKIDVGDKVHESLSPAKEVLDSHLPAKSSTAPTR